MKLFDDSDFDTIVFDEIFFNNIFFLTKIKKYVTEHLDKIIIATGDTNQLPPVEEVTNQMDPKYYLNLCVDQIFNNQLYLQDIKRIKDPVQKKKAMKLYDRILTCRSLEEREQ